jgi:hypothetical protein
MVKCVTAIDKTMVQIICSMKQLYITSRSLIIERLSKSNQTIFQIYNVQYLVSACIIS